MRAPIPRVSPGLLLAACCLASTSYGQQRTVIDDNFPGAYQVEVADVNGDKRPDVIAVGGSTCAWYENPTWKKRIVSTGKQTPGIISSATADLDGDGKAEIAIAYEFAMNTPATGKLLVARQGAGPDDPWKLEPIADVPSIHRLRWGDVDGDKRLDLVVAPIFGRDARPPDYASPARLEVFLTKGNAGREDWTWYWRGESSGDPCHRGDRRRWRRHLRHPDGLQCRRGPVPRQVERVVVDDPRAYPATAPQCGSSEVHLGRLADGRRFLATIEPWHGSEVVVCTSARHAGSVAVRPAGRDRRNPCRGTRALGCGH